MTIHTHSNTVTHTIFLFLSLLVFCVYIISLVKIYSESHSHSRSVPIYTSSSFSLHQYSTLFYLLSLIIIKCSFSFSSLDITLYFLFQEKLLLFSFQWIINKINVWMSFLLSTVFFHVFSTLVTQVSIPGGFKYVWLVEFGTLFYSYGSKTIGVCVFITFKSFYQGYVWLYIELLSMM